MLLVGVGRDLLRQFLGVFQSLLASGETGVGFLQALLNGGSGLGTFVVGSGLGLLVALAMFIVASFLAVFTLRVIALRMIALTSVLAMFAFGLALMTGIFRGLLGFMQRGAGVRIDRRGVLGQLTKLAGMLTDFAGLLLGQVLLGLRDLLRGIRETFIGGLLGLLRGRLILVADGLFGLARGFGGMIEGFAGFRRGVGGQFLSIGRILTDGFLSLGVGRAGGSLSGLLRFGFRGFLGFGQRLAGFLTGGLGGLRAAGNRLLGSFGGRLLGLFQGAFDRVLRPDFASGRAAASLFTSAAESATFCSDVAASNDESALPCANSFAAASAAFC